MRPKTVWQLAQKNNIQLPEANFEDFLPHIKITNNEADLLAFLKKLDWGVKVITSLDDVIRIGYENVEDAYLANIDYAELRFSPFYMAMTHQLPIEGVVEAIIEGVNQGCKKYPTKINLIGILSRTFGVENCETELNAILAHKDNIVALDLAGDEYNFPGNLFENHFKKALDAGLQITAHAGEAAGPESVWHAIEKLGATRIGHGVACVKDQELMDYMRKHEIGLESCLTSNYQTGTIKDLTKHPIKTFLANGLNVCLNTDDPAVENIELVDEFNLASKLLKLNEEQITQLQTNAIEMSFLSNEEKQSLRELKI
ncbi:MAG: adenosine deaminase [Colwellia sp.]